MTSDFKGDLKGKIAVVTGGNRGLGFETGKRLAEMGLKVILTSRDLGKGKKAAVQIGHNTECMALDTSSAESIENFCASYVKEFGEIDILVNNAGVFLDTREGSGVMDVEVDTIRKTWETNTLGPFLMCQLLVPLMVKNNWGRVVNVSSGLGQLTDRHMEGGFPAYRMSKTALNAVTKIFAEETKGKNILVNSVCPGWVRTDMGGSQADRSLEEGIAGIVWAATLPDDGPTGSFFRDGKQIPW